MSKIIKVQSNEFMGAVVPHFADEYTHKYVTLNEPEQRQCRNTYSDRLTFKFLSPRMQKLKSDVNRQSESLKFR